MFYAWRSGLGNVIVLGVGMRKYDVYLWKKRQTSEMSELRYPHFDGGSPPRI